MSLSQTLDRTQYTDTKKSARGFGSGVTPGGYFTIARTKPLKDKSVSPLDGITRRAYGFQDRTSEVVYSERGQFEGMSHGELIARTDLIAEQIQESYDENPDDWSGGLTLLLEKSNQSVELVRSTLRRSYWETMDAIEHCQRSALAVNRSPRGSKGITSKGRRKIESAATILEQRHGLKCLSFITFTVPPLPIDQMHKLCSLWHEVVRQTKQNLFRLQASKGLDTDMIGAIEIQEKRFHRTGQAVPHMHILLQGRKSKYSHWASSPLEFEDCYRRAIEAVLDQPIDMRAAVETDGLRKSVAGYMSKYMSKGEKSLQRFREWGEKLPLPTAWYTITKNLNKTIAQKTRRFTIDGCFVTFHQWLKQYPGKVKYRDFCLEETGQTVAIFGWIDPKDVDRFVDYMTRRSESVTQTQNVMHEQTG
jgi:hypothetical protein